MSRFDVVEVVYVLAHDYGLYGWIDRLTHEWRFHPTFSLRYRSLNADQKALYHRLEPRAEKTQPYDRKMSRIL